MMLISLKKILFPLLFIPQFLFSINNDSLNRLKKSPSTAFFYENQFEFQDSITFIDNSLNKFQNYLERNNLGNPGLPYNNFFIPPPSNNFGFNYFKNNYENYFLSPQKIKFYNTRVPYTDLFNVIGSKKEQIFKMTFSYNVKKNWNVTLDFNRIRSDGFQPRQNTNNNVVALSSNFKSKNNRYYFLANVIYNSAKNAENGGIVEDSVFSNTGVNLNNAKRTTINQSVFLKQYLNFGYKSTDTSKLNSIIPKSRLILTSMLENIILKYEDAEPLSGYYLKNYYDTARTYDSVSTYKLDNELAWKRLDNKKHRGFIDIFGFGFSVKDQFVVVKQKEINSTFNNISVGAELYNTYSKNKFWWNILGKYILDGYNKNNYYSSLTLKKTVIDSLNLLVFKAEAKSQSPDFIYNHYYSNNFKWDNNFSETQESRAGLTFSAMKYRFSIGADFSVYNNVLYYNSTGPAQHKGSIPVSHAFLKKDFTLARWHLDNKVDYQYVPFLSAIRVPELITENSIYYSSDMFKSAMKIQIGFSLFYSSAYYANAYMPATGQFYLQNNKKYGNYPFLDFFINAQVKSVRIFLKIDHLNSGWTAGNYELTPYYPANYRALKFGLSWRFFD